MEDEQFDPEIAERIAAIAKRFRVSPDSLVTFQKEGQLPERVRLDELLQKLAKKQKEQMALF